MGQLFIRAFKEIPFLDGPTHLQRQQRDLLLVFLVIPLRHFQRLTERLLHLNREPVLNAARQKAAGDKKEKNRWDHGESDEGGDELALEAGSFRLLAALEVKLNQIAGKKKNQQNSQGDVDVDQRQHQDIGRKERGPFDPSEKKQGQRNRKSQKKSGDQNGTKAPLRFRRCFF